MYTLLSSKNDILSIEKIIQMKNICLVLKIICDNDKNNLNDQPLIHYNKFIFQHQTILF